MTSPNLAICFTGPNGELEPLQHGEILYVLTGGVIHKMKRDRVPDVFPIGTTGLSDGIALIG